MTRKLIEVALPLEAISAASRRDKDRKTGTIKNVHKWFAPMPTPAWRALLFASIVDDPGEESARLELLKLVTELVGVDGELPSADVLDRARALIEAAGPVPTVLDPFCGGGSTIVEALRLGLPAIGSDLNPVPVLITKLLCELLPALDGRSSVTDSRYLEGTGGALDGFFADVRFHARRIREVVLQRVGHLFPPSDRGTVVAWLWARTVPCTNPACGATIPMYSSPWLSKQKDRQQWLQPEVNSKTVTFAVGTGASPVSATKIGSRGGRFRCLVCGDSVNEPVIREAGQRGELGVQLLAKAVDGPAGRAFLSASAADLVALDIAKPDSDLAAVDLVGKATVNVGLYGQRTQADLYTARQLVVLTAFADEVRETFESMRAGDSVDADRARAVATVLGLCVGKMAMSNSTQVRWRTREGPPKAEAAFGRQALPMLWDFVETSPFGGSTGDWMGQIESLLAGLDRASLGRPASVLLGDARRAQIEGEANALVATDPPYFAQIAYADLSDYFYVWHRLALRPTFPELFATMATPKESELVATPYRHDGDSRAAYDYYVDGFTSTFERLKKSQRPDLPIVVIYAHRQEEGDGEDGLTSSGWDALLEAMLRAGLGVVGTWPIHATSTSRQIGQGANALASYIVLVCRPRDAAAGVTDRPGFVRALRRELPPALAAMQAASTLPFDLTQAAIGPGMALFSRFGRVLEPSGEPMRVRTAIGLINQVRSEVLSEQDDEFDPETRWAIQWFERYGFDLGPFGEAEKLFTATATSLEGLHRTGIVQTKAPSVWLLEPEGMPADWDSVTDLKTCTWQVLMHLLRALHFGGGEQGAARLLGKVGRFGDLAHDLAYRVADVCESAKRASTALMINGLIAAWPAITRLAAIDSAEQGAMF